MGEMVGTDQINDCTADGCKHEPNELLMTYTRMQRDEVCVLLWCSTPYNIPYNPLLEHLPAPPAGAGRQRFSATQG